MHGIVQISCRKLQRLQAFEAEIQRGKSLSEDVQCTWQRHRICTDVPHVHAAVPQNPASFRIQWYLLVSVAAARPASDGSSGPRGKTRACRRKIIYDPTPTSRYGRGISINLVSAGFPSEARFDETSSLPLTPKGLKYLRHLMCSNVFNGKWELLAESHRDEDRHDRM